MSYQTENRMLILKTGLVSYEYGLSLQEAIHREICQRNHPPVLLLTEHFPVISLGKNADRAHLGEEGVRCQQQTKKIENTVQIIQSDRGGQVTAHMPGQMLAYPILRPAAFSLTVRSWVNLLEESVIRTIAAFGLRGERDCQYPGVWIDRQKIAALGIRIRQHISLHGISLNINPDLRLFDMIVPCGIQGRGVTSLVKAGAAGVSFSGVRQCWVRNFLQLLRERVAGLNPEYTDFGRLDFLPQPSCSQLHSYSHSHSHSGRMISEQA